MEKNTGPDYTDPVTNLDAYNQEKGTTPEQEKLARAKWLRDKIPKAEYHLLYQKQGVKFFIKNDEKVLDTPRMYALTRELKSSVDKFLYDIKDILPNRRPRFIITDLAQEKNPYKQNAENAAYVRDRIIYLDLDTVEQPHQFVHEYVHFLADLVPKQSYPLIKAEYKKMLDNYFRSVKKKKREDLELPSDEALRNKLALRLGLPSEYAFINPDEFLAEIITHWKKIPNNISSYRFKQAVKKILSRL